MQTFLSHTNLSRIHFGFTNKNGARVDRNLVNNGKGELVDASPAPLTPPPTALDALIRLYAVCSAFAYTVGNNGTGADIRDYGLTPELLDAASVALKRELPALVGNATAAAQSLAKFVALQDPTAKDLRTLEQLNVALAKFTDANPT